VFHEEKIKSLGHGPMVDLFARKLKALSSNLITTKKKKKDREN
jgi:hypothetical protein